ncbi:MAG: arginine repressor [Gemmatimonadetes bacterium]|nr:MAG: arginine repressor [Gemmatimonadota bacterium]
MGKRERHAAILELVRAHRITSQEALRELLAERGIEATQATLSRDFRELRLVKVTDAAGVSHYRLPEDWENTPPLTALLPTLFLSAEGTGNLLVVRTLIGGASAVAVALDWEEWPEVLGTIAGDDTILVIVRTPEDRESVERRLLEVAGAGGEG